MALTNSKYIHKACFCGGMTGALPSIAWFFVATRLCVALSLFSLRSCWLRVRASFRGWGCLGAPIGLCFIIDLLWRGMCILGGYLGLWFIVIMFVV